MGATMIRRWRQRIGFWFLGYRWRSLKGDVVVLETKERLTPEQVSLIREKLLHEYDPTEPVELLRG